MWFLTSHSVVQRSPAYTDTASCRLSSHNLLQNYTERNKNTTLFVWYLFCGGIRGTGCERWHKLTRGGNKQRGCKTVLTCWTGPSEDRDNWSTTPPVRQECCCRGNRPGTSRSGRRLCCGGSPDGQRGERGRDAELKKKTMIEEERYQEEMKSFSPHRFQNRPDTGPSVRYSYTGRISPETVRWCLCSNLEHISTETQETSSSSAWKRRILTLLIDD